LKFMLRSFLISVFKINNKALKRIGQGAMSPA
jgi:hypothetical protein